MTGAQKRSLRSVLELARFDPLKIYIVKYLHTSLSCERPVSVKAITEYLTENRIRCDEAGVIRAIDELQSSGIPIYASEQDSTYFYIEKT